ncbi:MAG: hypothetical protein WKF83_06305 [Nocardioidaceae bacterium]
MVAIAGALDAGLLGVDEEQPGGRTYTSTDDKDVGALRRTAPAPWCR